MIQTESFSQTARPILNLFSTVSLGYLAQQYDVSSQGLENLSDLLRCGPLPTGNIISNNPKFGGTDLSGVESYQQNADEQSEDGSELIVFFHQFDIDQLTDF
jgi:hypothetical protein